MYLSTYLCAFSSFENHRSDKIVWNNGRLCTAMHCMPYGLTISKRLCPSGNLAFAHLKGTVVLLTQTSHLFFLKGDSRKFSDTLEYAESFVQNKFSELMFVLFQCGQGTRLQQNLSPSATPEWRRVPVPRIFFLTKQRWVLDDIFPARGCSDFLYSTPLWLRLTLSNSCSFLLGMCSEYWSLGKVNFV